MKAWGLLPFLFTVFAAGALSLSPELQPLVGKSFVIRGPNCFSTALVASGVHDRFRGVSAREFQTTLLNNCDYVEQPEPGDMGVYSSPDGSLVIHAFIHLDGGRVLEKRGVQAGENNSVHVGLFVQTQTLYGQSDICLQYSPGPGCYNRLDYFRCHSSEPSSIAERQVDQKLEQILEGKISGDSLMPALTSLKQQIQGLKATQGTRAERLYSYEKQLEYIDLSL